MTSDMNYEITKFYQKQRLAEAARERLVHQAHAKRDGGFSLHFTIPLAVGLDWSEHKSATTT